MCWLIFSVSNFCPTDLHFTFFIISTYGNISNLFHIVFKKIKSFFSY